ncbi:tape measure protein [Brevundimonas sp. NPDC058933]|uniref:tape measure protein n=1 Tax=Brevundimonas sp. NPDC058933 TaxID=3346673 RepID=UPI003BEF0FE0
MGLLTGAFAILTVAGAAFTGLADKASQMEARLRIATTSAQGYAQASRDVVRIAQETRSELGAVTALYTKMAANSKTLGLNTAGVGVATRTFGMALKVSGASAQEAESSILQLGQAMASGVLNGDEFKSLAENSPVFMGILAKSMNVPLGALKKLGAEGKITGQQIAKALTDPAIIADIESKFGKIPVTFGDIMTTTRNVLMQGAGALFRGLGIDESLAMLNAKINQFGQAAVPMITKIATQIKGVFATIAPAITAAFGVVGPVLTFVGNNLETIAKVALSVGAAFTVMKASMALSSVIAQVTALGGAMGFAGGMGVVFSNAMGVARGAVNGFTVALLANPLTALATALTAGIVLLVTFSDKIKLPGQELGRLNDIVAVLFGDFVKHVGNTINGFVKFGNAVKSVFQAFMAIGRAAFNAVLSVASSVFSSLDRLTGGWMGKALSAVSFVADGFGAAFSMISSIWSNLPAIIGGFVTSTANNVIGGIESMVNRAIGGLNRLIDLANKLPNTNIDRIADVTFGRLEPGAYVGSVRGRAEARGGARAARNRAAGNTPPLADDTSTTTTPLSGGDDAKGAKSAQDRAKAMRDFWQGLEQSRDAAGLLGIELERHNAALEYRRILGDGDLDKARALTAEETTRINTLLRETATRKAIGELTQSATDHAREKALLEQRAALLGTTTLSLVGEEMAIRQRMDELRTKFLQEGANLSETELASMLAREESALRENAALERGNRLLEERIKNGQSLVERYSRDADPTWWAGRDRNDRDANIRSAMGSAPPEGVSAADWQRMLTTALSGSAREYDRTMSDIASKWRERMLGGIDQIADAFGGKLGDVIRQFGTAFDAIMRSANGDHSQSGLLGGIARLFGGAEGNRNAFGSAYDNAAKGFSPDALTKAFDKPLESLTSSFNSFQGLFKQGGGFTKALGSMLGAAGQGAMIGSAVGGIGKALFKDAFSNTGSQIGGMIGSVIGGPIGSIIGSIGGGLLGGLFGKKKKPTGSAAITMGAGGLNMNVTGNNGDAKEAASGAGQNVMSGLTSIAERLGVVLGGTANVAIGRYKNDWKVSTNGTAIGKKNGMSFGEDSEAAIAYAIKDAIRDGVLIGLSSFSDRVLKSSKNLDSAVSLAESYEKLLKELAAMKDPIGASINDLTTSMDRMAKSMREAGATSAEMAKLEEYKSLKLDALLKDQLSSIYDFRRDLTGEGSGLSAFSRLNTAQSEFAAMDALIRSGGTVDQDEFTRLGQQIFSLAGEVYGTSSSQFQAIRDMLMDATDGVISNVTKQFDDAQVQAINQQTDAIVGTQNVTNDLLRQVVERLGGRVDAITYDSRSAVNGRYYGPAV